MTKWWSHVTVLPWERTLMLRDGRIDRELEPGRHGYRPSRCRLIPVDMRPRLLTVSGQELLTGDGVTIRVSVQLTWRVVDATTFVVGAVAPQQVLYSAVQEAIRRVVATVTLDQTLADRALLSVGLAEVVADRIGGLGLEVTAIEARDLMLPGELRRAAAETVVAREHGRAELERARAEAATLRLMANTARLLEERPALLALRTLQAAVGAGSTVVLTSPATIGGTGP